MRACRFGRGEAERKYRTQCDRQQLVIPHRTDLVVVGTLWTLEAAMSESGLCCNVRRFGRPASGQMGAC